MNSAIGIVMAIVKTPHGLSLSAFTNASPTPASAMMMMKRMATAAVKPATGPISMRAISASDCPSAADRGPERDHVVDGARQTDAGHEPEQPRREPELRGQDGTEQRARAGNRREVVAEQHPLVRRVVVVAVLQSVRRRDAPVVEHHDLRRQERAVEAVRERR